MLTVVRKIMHSDPGVSLVISTYNWPEALELVLKSAITQHVLPSEIIVADDGSGIRTQYIVEKYQRISPIPIHHVWHEDQGFRKTLILNAAIRKASAAYIIQVDGDIILHPYFVRDHVRAARPNQFIRGSRAMINERRSKSILRSKQIGFSSLSKGVYHRFNALHLPWFSGLIRTNPFDPADVKGCNCSFWKADFVEVNGYNNLLNGWGHEDIELAARFINCGIRKKHLKLAAVCFHIHHALRCRSNEQDNKLHYKRVVENGIRRCVDGLVLAEV